MDGYHFNISMWLTEKQWGIHLLYVAHIEPHRLSEQHSVYYSDDEEDLSNWVERYESVFGGRSEIYKRAVRLMKQEHEDQIRALATDEEGSDQLV